MFNFFHFMKHLLHSYWGNKYQIQSSLIAPRNGNTVKQFFIKIKFSTTEPSLDNLSNKMKNILDVYHYLYILQDRQTVYTTGINLNDALDVLIVKVRLWLQVIFRALWDECLLLISCLQLNDNRFLTNYEAVGCCYCYTKYCYMFLPALNQNLSKRLQLKFQNFSQLSKFAVQL